MAAAVWAAACSGKKEIQMVATKMLKLTTCFNIQVLMITVGLASLTYCGRGMNRGHEQSRKGQYQDMLFSIDNIYYRGNPMDNSLCSVKFHSNFGSACTTYHQVL